MAVRPREKEREKEVYSSSHEKMEKGWWACFFLFLSRLKVMFGYTLSLLAAVTLGLKEEEEEEDG